VVTYGDFHLLKNDPKPQYYCFYQYFCCFIVGYKVVWRNQLQDIPRAVLKGKIFLNGIGRNITKPLGRGSHHQDLSKYTLQRSNITASGR
jgi:hypothetical protein